MGKQGMQLDLAPTSANTCMGTNSSMPAMAANMGQFMMHFQTMAQMFHMFGGGGSHGHHQESQPAHRPQRARTQLALTNAEEQPEAADQELQETPQEDENRMQPLKPAQQADMMLNAWSNRSKQRQTQKEAVEEEEEQKGAVEEGEDAKVLKKPAMKRPAASPASCPRRSLLPVPVLPAYGEWKLVRGAMESRRTSTTLHRMARGSGSCQKQGPMAMMAEPMDASRTPCKSLLWHAGF